MIKKILTIGALLALLVGFPIAVLAKSHHHRQPPPVVAPTPVPTPQPITSGNKCMNIGHDGQVVTSELQTLKAGNFNCIRLYYSSWGDPEMKTWASMAEAAGMYTIMGGYYGTLNQSQLNDYDAKVIADAVWAQAHGVQQFSLGNEQETNLGDLSVAQWVAHLDVLYPKVAAVYKGTISYEMNSEYLDSYKNVKSPILFGLNLYAGYSYNSSKLQTALNYFSGRAYVSETSCDVQYSTDCPTDATRAAETKSDYIKLVQNFPQVRITFFTYSANGGSGVPSQWGLQSDPLTRAVLGI